VKQLFALLALAAAASAQPGRFGLPACSAADQEFAQRTFFVLCHSSSLRVPLYVAYELEPHHLNRIAARPARFRRDLELTGASATNADYTHSGFSRGHMAPAADFAWSHEAIHATFLLSNAIPQNARVNSGLWARLEHAVRLLAAGSDALYVFTGPIFDAHPESIGSGVAVPSHIFKVVLAIKGDTKHMFAAIVPNSDLAAALPNDFTTSVEDVERRTGFDFFSALDDAEEHRLESSREPLPR
jgi:endonuclease G